jgi:hypothetical protein
LHDLAVELVDLLLLLGQDRHAKASRGAGTHRGSLNAVRQAEASFDGHTVLLQQKLQEPGVRARARGVLRHVLLGEGADVAGSGDDDGSEDGARHVGVLSVKSVRSWRLP